MGIKCRQGFFAKNGKLIPMDFDAKTAKTHVQGVARSRRGGLWVACDGWLKRWDGNHWIEDWGSSSMGSRWTSCAIETQNGYLAAATLDQSGAGLYLISPKGEVAFLTETMDFQATGCVPV